MPINTGYRGSTQDNSGGVIVAQSVNEVASANTLVVGVQEGNVSTYNETARLNFTSIDTPTSGDLSTTGFAGVSGISLFDKGNALNIAVRALCNFPSTAMNGRLVFYDVNNIPLGMSATLSFLSDPTLRIGPGSGYVCPVLLIDANQSRKAQFKVDVIASGTWSVYCRPV